MKIGVNGRFLTKPFTGIGQYTRFLFEALARQNPQDHFLILTSQKIRANFTKNVQIVILPERFPGSAGMKKTYWEQVQVPKYFLQHGVDIVHFPYPSNPWKTFKKPTVVTVHDTIPWTLSAYRRSVSTRLYQDRCRNAVKKAHHVVTVSESSKHEIIDICKIPAEKITTIHNAPAPFFRVTTNATQKESVLKKYGIDASKPFFLYTGGYDERKNVKLVVETFLEKIAPDFEANLVLAGGKAVNNVLYASFDELVKKQNGIKYSKYKGKIIVTGFIADADLPALYQSSFAFLSLSKKEGFNLPLIEAMVSGVPIIASDLAVHHEVADDYPFFCKPDDGQQLLELMKKLLSDREFYQQKKQTIENYRCPYSWEKGAKETMNVYLRTIKAVEI